MAHPSELLTHAEQEQQLPELLLQLQQAGLQVAGLLNGLDDKNFIFGAVEFIEHEDGYEVTQEPAFAIFRSRETEGEYTASIEDMDSIHDKYLHKTGSLAEAVEFLCNTYSAWAAAS